MFTFFAKKSHDCRGMSLVELIVVMAILSVVMLAVMSLYVPAHQSTIAQTQVSDIQGNLRLAMRVMTRDLLNAGFLVPDNPVIFQASATPTTADNPDSDDFTIRTRIIGNDFARISGVSINAGTGDYKLTVTDSDMVPNFPIGSRVRLFEPITAEEVIKDTGTSAARAYTVEDFSGSVVEIDPGANLTTADILPETVMIRVSDANQPALQTIRYQLNNGALQRVINGSQIQTLARNVDTSDTSVGGTSFFDFDKTDEGRVFRVDIKLTGKTKALKDDAISGEKSRSVQATVKLRNIF